MHAIKTLPGNYEPRGTLDLSRDTRALVWLNIGGLVLFVAVGWGLLWLTRLLREDTSIQFTVNLLNIVLLLGAFFLMVIAFFLMIVVHEAIHGVFFWIFTRDRPIFGFRGPYAFAAAPEWYLPRNHYLVVGLAPFVLITLCGIALIPALPGSLLLPMLLLLAVHAGGACGDLFVTGWCLRQPASILVRDVGDAMTIYAPTHSTD